MMLLNNFRIYRLLSYLIPKKLKNRTYKIGPKKSCHTIPGFTETFGSYYVTVAGTSD